MRHSHLLATVVLLAAAAVLVWMWPTAAVPDPPLDGPLAQRIAAWTAVLEREPGRRSEALLERARLLVQAGRFEDAERDCTACLETEPGLLEALSLRADARVQQGKWRLALADLDAVLHSWPKDLHALSQRSYVHLELQDGPRAVADARRVLELHPGDGVGLINLAWGEYLCGHPRDALRIAAEAIEVGPDLPHAYHTRARALEDLGRLREALPDLDVAVRLDPDRILYREDRARVLTRLGRANDAAADVARAQRRKAARHPR